MKQENCRNEIAFECDSCGNITMNHIVHQLFHNGDWVGDFCSSGCRDQFLLKQLLEEETIIAVTADNKPIMPDGEIIPLWELLGKPAI